MIDKKQTAESRAHPKLWASLTLVSFAACALLISTEPPENTIAEALFAFAIASGKEVRVFSFFMMAISLGGSIAAIGIFLALNFADARGKKEDGEQQKAQPKKKNWLGLLIVILGFAIVPRLGLMAYQAVLGTAKAGASVPLASGSSMTHGMDLEPSVASARGDGATATSLSSPLFLCLIAAVVLVSCLLAYFILVPRRRDASASEGRPMARVASPTASEISAARLRLELGDEARDDIIACYADMCELFEARSGEAPRKYLTAREFTRLLGSHGFHDAEIGDLTTVFEKARYSNEPCGEEDRQRAAKALRAIEGRHA